MTFLLFILGVYALVTSGENIEGDVTTTDMTTPHEPTEEQTISSKVHLPSSEATLTTTDAAYESGEEHPTYCSADETSSESVAGCNSLELLKSINQRLESLLSENISAMSQNLAIKLDSFAANTSERFRDIETWIEGISASVNEFKTETSQKLTAIEESLRSSDIAESLKNVSEGLEQLSSGTAKRLSVIAEEFPSMVQNVSTTVKTLVNSVTSTMEEAISHATGGSSVNLRRTPEKYFWHVENFVQVAQRAETSPTDVSSDVIVVSGYSVRINVQVNKFEEGLFLGLFFMLCPGPSDSYLEWPFKIPYSLSVVHPKPSVRAISRKFSMDTAKEEYKLCFNKPKEVCNTAFGYGAIALMSTLESDGYIMDGAINVALTLYP